MFFPTKFWFVTFLSDGKNSIKQLITYYKLIELFLVDFFDKSEKKIATFDVSLFPILLLEYVTSI